MMLNTLKSGPSVWNGLDITNTDAYKNSSLGGKK